MHKITQLVAHSFPLAFGMMLSNLFWKSNTLLFAVYCVIVVAVMFLGKDRKTELWIFLYGCTAGFVVETIGTQISGYQSFAQPDVWGIPFWLIISWGYGFILMKRIGFIIATGSPWVLHIDASHG